jgi:hypothetical protein
MHSMAYYIFLKSLRSLDEFRKNPHVKIPPKSPSTNFQSLGKFKNPIFIRKEFFLSIRPNRPSGQPAHPASQPRQPHYPPHSPVGRASALGPSRPTRHWRICQKRLFFEFAQPGDNAFSLCHRHMGPTCRCRRLPRAGRPRSEFLRVAAPIAPLPRASDAPELLQPSLITLPP